MTDGGRRSTSALWWVLVATPLLAQVGCAATVNQTGAPHDGRDGRQERVRARHEVPLLVTEVSGLALFHDEQLEAMRQVADWARQQRLRVVEVEHADQILTRARVGRHATSGERCGLPLSTRQAVERWQGALGVEGKIATNVGCGEKGCALSLRVLDRLDWDGAELVTYTAPFDSTLAWREALAGALTALISPPPGDTFGAGGLGGLRGTGVAEVREPRPESLRWRAWPARDIDGRDEEREAKGELNNLVPRNEQEVRRCLGEHDAGVELLIEVGAAGEVRRCQPRNAEDAPELCVCEALKEHAIIPAPMRDLRVFFGMALQRAELETPDGYVISASTRTYLQEYDNRDSERRWRPLVSDPSIEQWEAPTDSAIERCFAATTGAGQRGARVQVSFDAAGQAVEAVVEVAQGGAMTGPEASCLREVFLRSRAPCPAVPASAAEATVRVVFYPTPRAQR